jgi:hypothetical protein
MGSTDNKIYVYSVSAGYALNAVIGQHQAFITSVDFSEDSAWLQVQNMPCAVTTLSCY